MTSLSPDSMLPDELVIALREVRNAALSVRHAALSPAAADLRRALSEVEATRSVAYHWPLTARSLAEQPLVFANRLVRRYLRWYIGRVVEQQNAANDAVARVLELLAAGYTEIEASLHETQAN